MRSLWCWHLVSVLVLCWVSSVAAAPSRIGILVFDGVLTSDVTAPAEVFGAAVKQKWFSAHEVVLIAINDKQVRTEEGLKIVADATIADDISLDVLIVPGAYDVEPLIADERLLRYIQKAAKNVHWIASNCAGAFILGKAGVLEGRRATTWHGAEQDLQKRYPRVTVVPDENVVIDGNLVTSRGGVVSYDAALSLLELMSSAEHAQAVSRLVSYESSRKEALLCEPKHLSR